MAAAAQSAVLLGCTQNVYAVYALPLPLLLFFPLLVSRLFLACPSLVSRFAFLPLLRIDVVVLSSSEGCAGKFVH